MVSRTAPEQPRLVSVLDRWLWPSFAFLSLCWFVPGGINDWTSGVLHRQILLAGALLLGLPLEYLYLSRRVSWLWLRANPAPIIALAFGIWTLVASGASEYPIESLTGTLQHGDFGAIWYSGLSLAFIGVYLNTRRVPGAARRLTLGVVLAGIVLAVLALLEVLLGRPLIIASSKVPVATFLGPGHLAGALVLAAGLALGMLGTRVVAALAPTFLLAVALGATMTRTGPLALGVVFLLLALLIGRRYWRRLALGVLVTGGGIMLGIQLANAPKVVERQDVRDVGDATSLRTRALLAGAAIEGIADRPLFGFGGGNAFASDWYRYMSREELAEFLVLDHGFTHFAEVVDNGAGSPLFVDQLADGSRRLYSISGQKIHNQLLDMTIMWGVIGGLLLFALVLTTLPSLLTVEPVAVGMAAIMTFLMLWFAMTQLEGALWCCWAAACASGVRSSAGAGAKVGGHTPAAAPA